VSVCERRDRHPPASEHAPSGSDDERVDVEELVQILGRRLLGGHRTRFELIAECAEVCYRRALLRLPLHAARVDAESVVMVAKLAPIRRDVVRRVRALLGSRRRERRGLS
jgi:hypothetical protein